MFVLSCDSSEFIENETFRSQIQEKELSGKEVGVFPKFEYDALALHADSLVYNPKKDLIHPTIIKAKKYIDSPLGKYYMYYAPHRHLGISMAYADSLDGKWVEYENNPVIKGASAPDIRWIKKRNEGDIGKLYMWGHQRNSKTDLWTSNDGIHFEKHSTAIEASNINCRNATYTRVYSHAFKDSEYIMLYSGYQADIKTRFIWLAHSKDAVHWIQEKEPLLSPIEGENNQIYGPSFLKYGKNYFIVYNDNLSDKSGGNIKYVQVNKNLELIGERQIMLDPPSESPFYNRFRGGEFYKEKGVWYYFTGVGNKLNEFIGKIKEIKTEDTIP